MAVRYVKDVFTFVGLLPSDDEHDLIKRVIGVPGDEVKCCDKQGRITVNGVALNESSYIFPGAAPSTIPFDVHVKAGFIWVMGDNRGDSADSRYHMTDKYGGMVPISDVVGHAFVLIWPPSRAGGLGVPATFQQEGLTALSSLPTGTVPATALLGAFPLRLAGGQVASDGCAEDAGVRVVGRTGRLDEEPDEGRTMTVERPETGLPEAADPDEEPQAGPLVPPPLAGGESEGPDARAAGAGRSSPRPASPSGCSAGVVRPSSALGWVLFPFAVVWRFLFPKKPRPFLVELPFLVVFALVLAFLIKTFLVQAFYIPLRLDAEHPAAGRPGAGQPRGAVAGRRPDPRRGRGVPGPGQLAGDRGHRDQQQLAQEHADLGGPAARGRRRPDQAGHRRRRRPRGLLQRAGRDHGQRRGAERERYLYPGDEPNSGYLKPFDVTVPQGYLWVMGDHRSVSLDSRYHQDQEFGGMVPVGNVVGRADIVVWPISHWKTLPIPGTFKQVGLSALGLPGAIPGAALVGTVPLALRRRKRRRLLAAKRATTG